jgi:uncharacterized protein YkuJ
MESKLKTQKEYYKKGDTICEVRYGRNATVFDVTKRTVTFKLQHSTKKVTLHTLAAAEDFYKSHPVI